MFHSVRVKELFISMVRVHVIDISVYTHLLNSEDSFIPQDELYSKTSIAGVGDISKESLSLFHLLEPRVEILVIGTGSQWHRLNPELHKFMRSKGIAMEVQVTPHACSTFNFLVGEGRVVAAGLIPPER
ncbi:putative NADH dehydrogenase [Apostichopus japonicus]|uniref:Putative NADH dehydrogenase n=1 Tax=Stichopus japonicus TaxID=307972 RepID=A0A2G8L431_STIJA|nr:putative NADH dehydrogenase [Apostichopus japonicus]